ncbi:heterokaryon incompatibility protein-domain-containing protein, partial [Leptodontidium sp. 2 PMI_412]
LDDCSKYHSSCSDLPLTRRLPTRVIDVGPSDGSEEPRLYIHTEEAQHEAKFAALSYCWGKTQNLTLTTENLGSMKEIIPWDDIPLTIRDAIELTRGIGIRFLWVDALCIIQNSAEDWKHESAKMADVYGGAFVTIAASLAPDMHHGISRDRTFQEHILSVRYLAFGPDKLHYECRARSPQGGAAERTSIQSFASISKGAKEGTDVWVWYGIVQEYSYRRLTKSSDKIPALSGLAALYSERAGRQYMLGLWKETLIRDLLWEHSPAVGEGKRSRRQPEPSIPDFYRAPSWSWVSVDGRVEY